jgi:hypothetical protein
MDRASTVYSGMGDGGCSCSLCMIGSMETDGMSGVSLLPVKLMISGEVLLETVPYVIQDVAILPFLTSLIVYSCVEDESICNVNYLTAPICVVPCLRVCPTVQHLLVKILDRMTGII